MTNIGEARIVDRPSSRPLNSGFQSDATTGNTRGIAGMDPPSRDIEGIMVGHLPLLRRQRTGREEHAA